MSGALPMRVKLGRPAMPFAWAGASARLAASRGLDIEGLLLDAGVASQNGHISDDTPIDAAEFHLICNTLIPTVDDELHGAVKPGMQRGTASLGLQIMASSPDLRTAIRSLLRFYGMIGSFCQFEFRETTTDATITIRSGCAEKHMSCFAEEVMADWLFIQLCHVMQLPIRLSAFSTRSHLHPNIGDIHPYLQCPVRVADATSITLASTYLALPPKVKIGELPLTEAMFYWLRQLAEVRSLTHPDVAEKPVSRSLLDLISEVDLPFEQCARQLGLSERDLRQALFREGSGFRQLRKIALVDRVRPWLATNATLDDIAMVLGYSDARSLRRGLKLATGMSLSDLRDIGTAEEAMGSPTVLAGLRMRMGQVDSVNA